MKNSEFKVGDNIIVQGNREKIAEIENVFTETGRTATYFKVYFLGADLKGTGYDGGWYGCIDDYEMYGTFEN